MDYHPDIATRDETVEFLKTLSLPELKSQASANYKAWDEHSRTDRTAMRFSRLVSDECFRRIDEVLLVLGNLRADTACGDL